MVKKVAIFQNSISGGGRIDVMEAMIEALNDQGIVPDFITFRILLKNLWKDKKIKFKTKILKTIRLPHDLDIINMNLKIRNMEDKYEFYLHLKFFSESGIVRMFGCLSQMTLDLTQLAFEQKRNREKALFLS